MIEASVPAVTLLLFCICTIIRFAQPHCGSEYSEWVPNSYSCGGWIGTERTADWSLSCHKHDTCYTGCGETKWTCDASFHQDLYEQCDQTFGEAAVFCQHMCQLRAALYYVAVFVCGGWSYWDSQRQCHRYIAP